ncbi:unnamed protein product [Closterium sp. NIES-64]|nr:unnamed protein product [Closterium sp. NIES-64]CAI6005611.1 unnamed protein product [Closterium sp. NIES-64]
MPLVEPEAAETDREAPNRPLSPRSPARSEVPGVRRVEEAIAAIRRGEVSATVVWLGERVRAVDDWMGSEWREVRSKPWKPTAPALFSLNLFLCSPALAIARIVVVVDEHSRDVADLIMPASLATAERMAFMVRHGSGIVSAAASPAVLDRLSIPPMLAGAEGIAKNGSPSSVSVDVAVGTTTGISAADRARTLRALADAHSLPADFCRPGHIFPLRAHPGGVLRQAMRVEAAADMAVLAGLPPVTAVTELLNDDGSLPDAAQTQQFAAQNALTLISIQDIVRHRRLVERTVRRTALARLPTEWGTFDIVSYISDVDGIEHVAMVKGDISSGEDVMVRVHSECLTGDIFASARCDCGPQLQQALRRIEAKGRGVCIYLRGQEGRGIGLGHKLQAYNLQDMGRDTVQANLDLGMPADAREYSAAAHILRDLGVRSLQLMTNNPAKLTAISELGFAVNGRVPVLCPINMENRRYLETKRAKMGHLYDASLAQPISGGWEARGEDVEEVEDAERRV